MFRDPLIQLSDDWSEIYAYVKQQADVYNTLFGLFKLSWILALHEEINEIQAKEVLWEEDYIEDDNGTWKKKEI